jgi:hypothetical protein
VRRRAGSGQVDTTRALNRADEFRISTIGVSDVSEDASTTTAGNRGMLKKLLWGLPYIAIYGISIWLIALTNRDPAAAYPNWQWFIPLVALVSIIGGWRRMERAGGSVMLYLFKQVLHWGALMLVLYLLFLPGVDQLLSADSNGFVVIYLLGLTALLSGIYLDWKMAVFGLFLIGSGVGIAYLEDNAMLITIAGVGLFAILVTVLTRSRA